MADFYIAGNYMFEVTHLEQGVGDLLKFIFLDIYVKNRTKALTGDTDQFIQSSKLFIIETAKPFVLKEDEGVWCSAVDGTLLA